MAQGDIIQMMPTGSVHMFPVNSVKPGFSECDGGLLNRIDEAALFAVIGITYGAGDGSTTFNKPDYRGEFLRGWDNGRGVDSGRAIATTQTEAINSGDLSLDTDGEHNHSINYDSAGGFQETVYTGHTKEGTKAAVVNSGGSHSHAINGGTETRPRNLSLMYCIKV